MDGGDWAEGSHHPTNITADTALARPTPDPVKDHHTFGGWYSNSGLSTAYNFGSSVTGDLNLYAQWTPILVSGVTLNKSALSLPAGSTETLTATVAPANALNKNVNWSSNNATVASVNNGVVTAIAVGTATITVTTADGNKTASCVVTVSPQVTTGGIVIELADMNEWNLTGQTASAIANVDKEFSVSGTYTSYRWYVNGIPVGTSSSYTFNRPEGVYELVLVVTNSNGESRSGRCRITTVIDSVLIENIWVNGSITTATGEDWYLFPVTAGTMYRVWWNDRKQGDGTKTGDIAVSARYEGSSTWIFGGTNTSVDNGWGGAQSFTANQTGIVEIMVIPYNRSASNTGTYGIVYSTGNTRVAPSLNENEWADGSITTATGEDWYLFPVTAGTTYRVWWNDRKQGNGRRTGDIVVGARYLGSSSWIFGGTNTTVDSGWDTPQSFTANQTGTVEIRVMAYDNSDYNTGTYGIVYSTDSTRVAFPLTENKWTNGSITVATGEDWYSIPVTAGTRYYIWWKGVAQFGDGTKTGYMVVGARYEGSSRWIFGGTNTVDDGWGGAQSFTANQTGIVEIRVMPYNGYTSSTGTYGIVYTTYNNSRVPPENFAPLTENEWINGNLAVGREDWYSIPVTAGTTYRVWWNDYYQGDGTKTTNIYVGARYEGSSTWIFSGPHTQYGGDWNIAQSFTANQTGIVEIMVKEYRNGGTYGIVYSTGTTRPAQ